LFDLRVGDHTLVAERPGQLIPILTDLPLIRHNVPYLSCKY
jgi:hypothetical protein